jgi:hypothetical protein
VPCHVSCGPSAHLALHLDGSVGGEAMVAGIGEPGTIRDVPRSDVGEVLVGP